ncbi:hypothetical protein VFPPC_04551 [Pochonia chlamydosporia 170]|uniref:Uncharacterized protein n=1 Tax=Pochonia chlamydosporia 170 TaxID=1380566 RepID=A0A179FSS5_METCM|nr:hypothetical protein VFPPC_04551 [Pochonia chlamydosporia 170]OAQ68308.2 hypothetical protein VFPPC_04551 [Pochonia chlamydosporia 170]
MTVWCGSSLVGWFNVPPVSINVSSGRDFPCACEVMHRLDALMSQEGVIACEMKSGQFEVVKKKVSHAELLRTEWTYAGTPDETVWSGPCLSGSISRVSLSPVTAAGCHGPGPRWFSCIKRHNEAQRGTTSGDPGRRASRRYRLPKRWPLCRTVLCGLDATTSNRTWINTPLVRSALSGAQISRGQGSVVVGTEPLDQVR